jgi:hypothetical protein
MKEWAFEVFVDDDGHCDFVEEWRRDLPPRAKTKLAWMVRTMKSLSDWPNSGYIEPLYEGIFEIKFRIRGNIVYRPLGCYGPDQSFIFLVGAREHGDRFEPKSAPGTALKRKTMLLSNKGGTREYY